ncbi:ABC transporter ATP-binding protein [Tistrella mobilis]
MTALTVENLRIDVPGGPAVAGLDLAIGRGRVFCLVGESGCGKSLTALALMGLLPAGARVVSGTARIDGRPFRPGGPTPAGLAMVHQDAMASLDPLMTVGRQIAEPLVAQAGLGRRAAMAEAVRLMERVGIAGAAERARAWPHEFSGGMNQRVAIAMALACRPALLIADEPTTALDVTVQAQILDLLTGLAAETGMGLVFITHDLGVVAEIADEMAVMYAGRIVEQGPVGRIFDAPAHPYTAELLACRPGLEVPGRQRPRPQARDRRLAAIPGMVPPPGRRGPGCDFAPRCRHAIESCSMTLPKLRPVAGGGLVACGVPA